MAITIGRREFISVLGSAAVGWPRAAHAQLLSRLPTIGLFSSNTRVSQNQWNDVFVQRLRELGWIEGRTIRIEYRWAEGHPERYDNIAAELVRLKVDVILIGGPAILAVKQATSVIPVVFLGAADPVGSGLVASLAHPGGNLTGLSSQSIDLIGKRLELLHEVVPGLRRLAVMANIASAIQVREMCAVLEMARSLGLETIAIEYSKAEDITPGLEVLKGRADAMYVVADPIAYNNRARINTLALGARLPTIYLFRDYIEPGGLMSYGPSFSDQFRHAADYVDKILRGAKPADLPVEQPTKFELVINLTTAKALGLTVPESFLLRADEVIE